jgi:outer membrane protein
MLGYKGMSEPQGSATKLAYIDSNVIIAQTPGSEEAQATFDREMARWQTEVQVLADSLQQMMAAYEQQQIMLSPEAKQERQQEILQKRMEYDQRVADLEQVAQRRQQELLEPIFARVGSAIEEIRSEHQYSMVFDKAALSAADTTLDITLVVIERLNQQGTTPGNTQNQ